MVQEQIKVMSASIWFNPLPQLRLHHFCFLSSSFTSSVSWIFSLDENWKKDLTWVLKCPNTSSRSVSDQRARRAGPPVVRGPSVEGDSVLNSSLHEQLEMSLTPGTGWNSLRI